MFASVFTYYKWKVLLAKKKKVEYIFSAYLKYLQLKKRNIKLLIIKMKEKQKKQ